MTEQRKAKSPYQKKGKTPYRYSELYYSWRNATGATKRRLGEQHTARFCPPREVAMSVAAFRRAA